MSRVSQSNESSHTKPFSVFMLDSPILFIVIFDSSSVVVPSTYNLNNNGVVDGAGCQAAFPEKNFCLTATSELLNHFCTKQKKCFGSPRML